MRGEARDKPGRVIHLAVLECNARAVEVYQSCQWMTEATDAGLVWKGIAASELSSALDLAGLTGEERAEAAHGVRVMEREAYAIHADRYKAAVSKINSKARR